MDTLSYPFTPCIEPLKIVEHEGKPNNLISHNLPVWVYCLKARVAKLVTAYKSFHEMA
jgi:hypothetical protein